MEKTVDELYFEIAKHIVDAIDDNWKKAEINFEYFGDAGEFTGRYNQEDSHEERDFSVGYKSYKAFKLIHKITTEDGANKWNRAKFILYPTGKFSIDFEWDQDLADEVARNS